MLRQPSVVVDGLPDAGVVADLVPDDGVPLADVLLDVGALVRAVRARGTEEARRLAALVAPVRVE